MSYPPHGPPPPYGPGPQGGPAGPQYSAPGPGWQGPPPPQQPPYPGQAPPPGRPPKKSSGTGLAIAAVVGAGVLLIGGIGAGAYLVLSSAGSPEEASSGGGGSTGAEEGSPAAAGFDGVWDAEMEQFHANGDSAGTWTMHLTIENGEVAEARESGMPSGDGECTWEVVESSTGSGTLTFAYIVENDSDCADNGAVNLTGSGGSIDAEVTSILHDGQIATAEGVLEPR
ncbi:hypothetical protein [Nocardiopsis coralliicola]